MIAREVKADALRHLAAVCRESPTEGALWEGARGSGLGSYAPDEAGTRAAGQFHAALLEIAGELEAQADRLGDTPARRALAAKIADEHRRAAVREWEQEPIG